MAEEISKAMIATSKDDKHSRTAEGLKGRREVENSQVVEQRDWQGTSTTMVILASVKAR